MERLNVMSGILAFSFPCLIGAGIAMPVKVKAEALMKHDSLMHQHQHYVNHLKIDSATFVIDSIYMSQSTNIK